MHNAKPAGAICRGMLNLRDIVSNCSSTSDGRQIKPSTDSTSNYDGSIRYAPMFESDAEQPNCGNASDHASNHDVDYFGGCKMTDVQTGQAVSPQSLVTTAIETAAATAAIVLPTVKAGVNATEAMTIALPLMNQATQLAQIGVLSSDQLSQMMTMVMQSIQQSHDSWAKMNGVSK